jgi:hypothetical protein
MYSDGADEYTRYVPVHIVEEIPQSLELYMMPKTEYFIGETFSYEGLGAKLVYNNGSEKLLSSKNISISSPNMNVTGTQTITVSYEYAVGEIYTCTYDITVTAISVIGIQIAKLPEKLVYKTPIDGLSGLSDEENLGFTYAVLDNYIRTGVCEDPETKEKIDNKRKWNKFKLELMPAFKYDGPVLADDVK